jgi:hypothetical protein
MTKAPESQVFSGCEFGHRLQQRENADGVPKHGNLTNDLRIVSGKQLSRLVTIWHGGVILQIPKRSRRRQVIIPNHRTMLFSPSWICPNIDVQILMAAFLADFSLDLQFVSEHSRDLPEEFIGWDRPTQWCCHRPMFSLIQYQVSMLKISAGDNVFPGDSSG